MAWDWWICVDKLCGNIVIYIAYNNIKIITLATATCDQSDVHLQNVPGKDYPCNFSPW